MNNKYQIQFGPFYTDYHQNLVDEQFLSAVTRFIDEILVPQLEDPLKSVQGKIFAAYNEERYCGPLSQVKNIFKFDLELLSNSGVSDFEKELEYESASFTSSKRFKSRNSLDLWTPARKENRQTQIKKLEKIYKEIEKGNCSEKNCPFCGGELKIVNKEHIFDLACFNFCFRYHYHKDPKTGEFLHGHSVIDEPIFQTKEPNSKKEVAE